MKKVLFLTTTLIIILFLISCGGGGNNPVTTSNTTTVETESTSAVISSSSGGSLSFSDGTKIDVPAGAVSVDTEITAEKPKAAQDLGTAFASYIELGPDTVSLQKPVTITLTYDESKISDEADIRIISLSTNNTMLDLGSEKSYFTTINTDSQDKDKNTVTFSMSHFSLVSIFWEDKAYLVLDLPGKYLKKGDLIYALTGATSSTYCNGILNGCWFPGHAALYLGTTDANAKTNDGSTTIESTPESAVLGQKDGVQFSTLNSLKTLQGQHIFMGARRPVGTTLTNDLRTKIANYAISKIGIGYRDIGGGSFLNISDFTKISCAGLTELAYQAAGIDLVAEVKELLLYPIRQFVKTKPVDEIYVNANDKIDFMVYGVIKNKSFTYTKDDTNYSISASASPDIIAEGRATFTKLVNGSNFVWTPKNTDIGKSFKITFTLGAGSYGTITQDLTINVSGSYFPVIDGASYTYVVIQSSSNNPTANSYTTVRTMTNSGSTIKMTDTINGVVSDTYLEDSSGFWVQKEFWINGQKAASFSPYAKIISSSEPQPQDSWDNNFNVAYTNVVAGGPITIGITESNSIDTDYTTLEITAGKFEKVLKITRNETWSVPDQSGFDNDGNPATIKVQKTVTGTDYFAPGVGLIQENIAEKEIDTLVKSNGSTETQTITSNSTQILTSYNIPATKL